MALQRLVELVVSARNERRLRSVGGQRVGPDGFAALVVVHVGLYVLVPLEWATMPWPRVGWWTWPLLGVAVAAMGLRYWAAVSLGERYTVRVVRLPQVPLVHGGPYRWMRHPIYGAVAVEVVVLPLAFGSVAAALVLGVLNLWALARRIRMEETALALR